MPELTRPVRPMESKSRRNAIAASASLLLAGALIAAACVVHSGVRPDELLSPLQVGRYAVRAERQSKDYDEKAERQIAFATDSDDAATSERELAAKEEKRARQSAYLAADVKSRIDKILEAGRDQVGPCAEHVDLLTLLCSRSCGVHFSPSMHLLSTGLCPASSSPLL